MSRGVAATAATPTVEPPSATPWQLTRHITCAGVAGVLTGLLVAGLGGRLFMRIAAAVAADAVQGARTEAGFTVGEVTVGGTLGLVVFAGLFAGLAGAVFYAIFRPWLYWAGRWRGVAFGVLVFAVGSATSDMLNPDNVDFFILGNGPLLVLLIAGLFVVFGVAIDGAFASLDRRLPSAEPAGSRLRLLYGLVTLQGSLVAVGLLVIVASGRSCDCEPPLLATASVVVAAAGTLVGWAAELVRDRPGMRATAQILGLGGTAGAALFGLTRALSDATAIIT